jgi:hypothetical protein
MWPGLFPAKQENYPTCEALRGRRAAISMASRAAGASIVGTGINMKTANTSNLIGQADNCQLFYDECNFATDNKMISGTGGWNAPTALLY